MATSTLAMLAVSCACVALVLSYERLAEGAIVAMTPPKRASPPQPVEVQPAREFAHLSLAGLGVVRLGDTRFFVERALVDDVLEEQAELLHNARIVPELADGKPVCVRLYGVRRTPLLGTLGFQNGDCIETVNGFDLASPERALTAYANLRTSDELDVTLRRRDRTIHLVYDIE